MELLQIHKEGLSFQKNQKHLGTSLVTLTASSYNLLFQSSNANLLKEELCQGFVNLETIAIICFSDCLCITKLTLMTHSMHSPIDSYDSLHRMTQLIYNPVDSYDSLHRMTQLVHSLN